MYSLWWRVSTGEVVALLQSFGFIFDVPAALLGQTALAWGNSVGDAFANAALARQGHTKMAITGCFAAPLFNVLCGFGVALLIECIKGIGGCRYALSAQHGFVRAFWLRSEADDSAVLSVSLCDFLCSVPGAVYAGCSTRPSAWERSGVSSGWADDTAGRGCMQRQYNPSSNASPPPPPHTHTPA